MVRNILQYLSISGIAFSIIGISSFFTFSSGKIFKFLSYFQKPIGIFAHLKLIFLRFLSIISVKYSSLKQVHSY